MHSSRAGENGMVFVILFEGNIRLLTLAFQASVVEACDIRGS